MTSEEKNQIILLRKSGNSYGEISKKINISESTIKSFIRRNTVISETAEIKVQIEKRHCKFCGKGLKILEKNRPKLFCSSNCRISFWRKSKKFPINLIK